MFSSIYVLKVRCPMPLTTKEDSINNFYSVNMILYTASRTEPTVGLAGVPWDVKSERNGVVGKGKNVNTLGIARLHGEQ